MFQGRSDQMRSALSILPFWDLVTLMDITMMRKIIQTGAPAPLYDLIDFSHRTRAYGGIRIRVIPRTEKSRRSFMFRAARAWNSLPHDLRELPDYKFQPMVKQYLLGDFNGPGD